MFWAKATQLSVLKVLSAGAHVIMHEHCKKHKAEFNLARTLWVTEDHKASAGTFVYGYSMCGCMCVMSRDEPCLASCEHCSLHMETFSAAASALGSGPMCKFVAFLLAHWDWTIFCPSDSFQVEKPSWTIGAGCSTRGRTAEKQAPHKHIASLTCRLMLL